MKTLLLLPLLAGCASVPPYIYTEISSSRTDLNIGEGDMDDAETLMFTVGVGWYTRPIPVRVAPPEPVRAPVLAVPVPVAEDPIPPTEGPWWQDEVLLGWAGGVIALLAGGGYGVRRWRRNGARSASGDEGG